MFDFDVLGIGDCDDRDQDLLAVATIRLNAAVNDVPRGPALVLSPETTIGTAIESMRRRTRGAAVVARQQRPLGVITDRDILAQALGEVDQLRDVPVSAVMTAGAEALRPDHTVGAALRRMCATRRWHLPLVCGRGLLVGSIDIADISLWLRDRMTMVSVDAALAQSWARGA